MASNDLAKLTKAQLIALLTASPAAPSEASQHYTERDLAVTCCDKTFRTIKGRAFHLTNTHPKGKARS